MELADGLGAPRRLHHFCEVCAQGRLFDAELVDAGVSFVEDAKPALVISSGRNLAPGDCSDGAQRVGSTGHVSREDSFTGHFRFWSNSAQSGRFQPSSRKCDSRARQAAQGGSLPPDAAQDMSLVALIGKKPVAERLWRNEQTPG